MAGWNCAGLVLLVMATTMAIAEARTIVVGGSENWRYGYNYTDWALKNSPFFINDKLVFKYGPPHNVYLLPNLYSYVKCDFKGANLLAGPSNGAGNGFEVVLNQYRLYYFASSSDKDCSDGLMKFFAFPLPRWY
ncbi:Phytocyanin domain-containing protein [Psidium guajava]|nr:Phytocyanin domain-containing protein [Psidium guajava]